MTLRNFQLGAILGAITLLLVACSSLQPIQNFSDQYVPTNFTMSQIKTSIQTAIVRSHWHSQAVRPGLIVATLKTHGTTSVVNIAYDTKSYSINYKSSVGLDKEGNRIHKNYNRWLANLNTQIQLNFQKLKQHAA
jgi:hypothetical protein